MLVSLFYVIGGQEGKRHVDFRAQIAKEFGIYTAVQKHSPPHITLKYDVEVNEGQLIELETAIAQFARKGKPSSLRLTGLGSFDDSVVYVGVEPDAETQLTLHALDAHIATLDFISFRHHERENRNLHATLARKIPTQLFQKVWDYSQQHLVDVTLPFDNISICPIVDDRRVIHKQYFLGQDI